MIRQRATASAWLLGFATAFLAAGSRAEAPSPQDARAVTLVRDGVAQLPILVGGHREPALELRHTIERMSNARLQVLPAEKEHVGIHVGTDSDFPWLSFDATKELGAEGFLIHSDGKSLFLLGHQPAGVQHAVSTFLGLLGCRWFFPGSTWEIIPRQETITGSWSERQTPSFVTQRHIWYGFGAYPKGAADRNDWNRHNRMGGPIKVNIGHTWHGLDPEREFDAHPDWFALVRGKRQPSKPCYSHPQVLERAVRFALDVAARGTDMVSMSPPDGLGYCECKRCLAVFEGGKTTREHGSLFARRPDGVLVNVTSETLFRFINKIAAALSKEHPQTLVGCYAYSAYSHPPSFKLHPNVYLQVTSAFRRTALSLEEQLNAFGQKTSRLGIREYFSVFQWDWDYPDPGKIEPYGLQELLRRYRQHGITALNAESSCNWAARGLGYYVASQLLWDVDADVKTILQDFYERAFGPAALPIQRYYARWYGPGVAVLDDSAGPPKKEAFLEKNQLRLQPLREAFADLDKAAALAVGSDGVRSRVDHLRLYAHYLLLRYLLEEAEESGDETQILAAIRAETVFAGRLTDLHLVHSRALLGKAFLRRFRRHTKLLEDVLEASRAGEGWRSIGTPPDRAELDRLWAEDRETLNLR